VIGVGFRRDFPTFCRQSVVTNVALRFRAINQRKVDFTYSIIEFCVGKALLIANTFMVGQVIAPALAEIQFKFVINSTTEFRIRLSTLIWLRSLNWNLDNSPKNYRIKRCEYTNRLQILRRCRKSQNFGTLYTRNFEILSFKGSEVKYREFHIFVILAYSSAILTTSYGEKGWFVDIGFILSQRKVPLPPIPKWVLWPLSIDAISFYSKNPRGGMAVRKCLHLMAHEQP
jgi:hypothetical protein